jgi:hypothetical protein
LFQRNVLVALCTNEGCVSAAVRLSEHIAAHDTPATYRNPHCGSFVRCHESPRVMRMQGIIQWNGSRQCGRQRPPASSLCRPADSAGD